MKKKKNQIICIKLVIKSGWPGERVRKEIKREQGIMNGK